MSCFSHRGEGQGEEGPVDPQPPARERDRSHSKTKKARRHAEQGAETPPSATPAAAELKMEAEPQSQVGTLANLRNVHYIYLFIYYIKMKM